MPTSPSITQPTRTPAAPTRRSVLGWLLGLALGLVTPSPRPLRASSAREFFIVVNAKNPLGAVSRAFLVDAFLKKIAEWPSGARIRPVDQHADAPVRKSFTNAVLNRTVTAVRRYWQQRIFSGRDLPPPELASDEAVLRFVAGHPGGIGYVSTAAKLEGTKLVDIV
jgi:hypothetical protein